ncbi:unnamed protein product, partial [marine sediment metagenome]
FQIEEREKPLSELSPGGLVRRGAAVAGETLFKGVSKVTQQLGRPTPTEEQVREAGSALQLPILFGGFSPALPTTTDIRRTLNQETRVAFAGAQQKQSDDIIQTDIKFQAKTGSRKQIGRTTGFTQQAKINDRITISTTKASGKFGTKVVDPTTGQVFASRQQAFGGQQVSLGAKFKTPTGQTRFVQEGFGVTVKGTGGRVDASTFTSKGVTTQFKDFTASTTRTTGF